MKILSLDTSTAITSVAIMDKHQIIGEITLNDKKTHSQKLMLLVQSLLELTDTSLTDLDAIAVGVGPGSFTGLRIGVTTAKGLAHGSSLPLLEVSSLKALTHQAPQNHAVVAMMDARRDTVFVGFLNEGFYEEDQLHIDDVIKKCQTFKSVVFVGDGAVLHTKKIQEGLGEKSVFLPNHLNSISAASICYLAHQEKLKQYDDVHVTYLRKSQAEREYDERQSK